VIMRRHPFDPVSAVLGILTVTFGVVVMTGEAPGFDAGGGWWIAVAALLVGVAILPWRRGSVRREVTGDPTDTVRPHEAGLGPGEEPEAT